MWKRISVDDHCYDARSCQSVWQDDDRLEDLLIIGHLAEPGSVPLAAGEVAIRVRRQVIVDAQVL
jgi:hypothetical protein